MTRRGTAAAYPDPLRHAPNAALLIDFDNVTMGIRSDLQIQLRRLLSSEVFKGKISVQRAYADWRRYPQYIVPLSEASIDLIFAPAFGSNKKNATDIRLAIDALELVFTRPEIGTYILLSGDSDFSSLVLKLKEYGKYVIGVGMRESSSDLLIQNCDEYYSYNELTGLLKEGEVEHRRRDPWELVVESATRMQRANDVMRSDRLKQVMQEIDPNFDEKDAGFSKYSKFLQEAARRGLLRLSKMENGQYEIAVGPNANVPLELDTAAAPPASRAEPGESRSRRQDRPRGAEPRGRAGPPEGLTLAEALGLLRQALEELGATGDEATDADQARERMAELHGRPDEPVLEARRFQRFLRQAHDAGVVDLAKADGGVYLLRLRPPPEPEAEADDAPAEREHARADGEHGRRRGERGGRGGRGGRGRRRSREEGGDEREPRERAPARDSGGPGVSEARPPRESRRNPRFRRGSRGPGGSTPTERPAEPAATSTVEEPAATGPVTYNRAVRGRRGRRGGGPAEHAAGLPAPEPSAGMEREVVTGDGRPSADAAVPAPPATPPPSSVAPEADQPAAESGSLFKRMSAALQRAMLGGTQKDDADGS
jgi:uncharacterized protein (TIGR00288 family)